MTEQVPTDVPVVPDGATPEDVAAEVVAIASNALVGVAAGVAGSIVFRILEGRTPTTPAGAGATGPKGEQGEKGEKGDKGDTGDPGSIGPQGVQGPIGPTGETGPTGPIGPAGAASALTHLKVIATRNAGTGYVINGRPLFKKSDDTGTAFDTVAGTALSYDAATGKFTVVTPGLYLVTYSADFRQNTGGNLSISIGVFVNGVDCGQSRNRVTFGASVPQAVNLVAVLDLAIGDVVFVGASYGIAANTVCELVTGAHLRLVNLSV